MADKVKLSKDGSSIDFIVSENIPASVKKFRHSPEIEGLYRFIFENDLQKEAFEIMERIVAARKAKKLKDKQDAMPAKKVEPKIEAKAKKAEPTPAPKTILKPAAAKAAPAKVAAKTPAAKPAAKAVAKKADVKKPAKKK